MTEDKKDAPRPAQPARSGPDQKAESMLDRDQWIARALAAAANHNKRPDKTKP